MFSSKTLAATIAFAAMVAVPVFAQTSADPAAKPEGATAKVKKMLGMHSDDSKFVKEATIGGMYEVEAGKVALANGSSDQVKQLAQHIVDDHSKAGEELKQIAQSKNMEVPTALDSKHQKKIDKLKKQTGADFDKAYADAMVDDHQADIKKFDKEAKKGKDADLKQFAANTLPKLNEHLTMAKTAKSAAK